MLGAGTSSRTGKHDQVAVLFAVRFGGVMAVFFFFAAILSFCLFVWGKGWGGGFQQTKVCAGWIESRHRPVSSIWWFATPVFAVSGGLGMRTTRLALLRTFLQCRWAFGSGWFGTARLRLMHMSDDRVGSVAKTANLRQSRKAPNAPGSPMGTEDRRRWVRYLLIDWISLICSRSSYTEVVKLGPVWFLRFRLESR